MRPFPPKQQLEHACNLSLSLSPSLSKHANTHMHGHTQGNKSNLLSVTECGGMDDPAHLVTITSQAASLSFLCVFKHVNAREHVDVGVDVCFSVCF